MNKPNVITTPSGDRMVLIPFEEYEHLVEAAEDAADARDVDEIKRKLANGEEELIPAEVADRIIDGENKIGEPNVLPITRTLIDNLVMLAKEFAEIGGVKITTVGTNSTKTASFYVDLDEGKTSCTLRKYDVLTAWFAANWPEGHNMPTLRDPQHYQWRRSQDSDR
jgi:hypothetical protein